MKEYLKNKKGLTGYLTLLLLFAIIFSFLTVHQRLSRERRTQQNISDSVRAHFHAEAGLADALFQLTRLKQETMTFTSRSGTSAGLQTGLDYMVHIRIRKNDRKLLGDIFSVGIAGKERALIIKAGFEILDEKIPCEIKGGVELRALPDIDSSLLFKTGSVKELLDNLEKLYALSDKILSLSSRKEPANEALVKFINEKITCR